MREPGPGSRLGQYRLIAPIGAGGMGRVWAALDEAASGLRLVAVKVALEGEGSDERYWSALSDEASVASRISHPNVCSTYELGVENGVHFLVMEWSDGASLRDLLDALPGQRLSPQLAAQVGASVAAGLHAAHQLCDETGHSLGVVHRDVSPQNVLISMGAHVRLADFGVAKARGQIRRATETGELKGKLSYMAPEQISSKMIDRRADVFALGCVIYEAALGVRAFHGTDALSTMYLLLEQPVVPPREIEPTFPEGLEAILLKAMAKDPAERYQTAEELREALLDDLRAQGHVVSDRALAASLEGALGKALATRNRDLRASAELLRRGEKLPSQGPVPSSRGSHTPGGIEKSAGRRSATTITTTMPRRGWPLWTLASALITVAALSGVAYSRRAQAPAPPAPAAQPAPAAEPAPTVVQPEVTSELAAPTPTPNEPVQAAASATAVEATPPPDVEKKPRGRAPKLQAVVKPPPEAAAPAAPATSPFELPPRGSKPVRPPREIDQSNPFAKP